MNVELETIKAFVESERLTRDNRYFTRKDEDKWRRYYLFHVLRTKHKQTLANIGKIFSLDHSTIVHGLKQWDILKDYEDVQRVTHEVQNLFPESGTHIFCSDRLVTALLILESQVK